jgi:oligo-1,6-glucosidase
VLSNNYPSLEGTRELPLRPYQALVIRAR